MRTSCCWLVLVVALVMMSNRGALGDSHVSPNDVNCGGDTYPICTGSVLTFSPDAPLAQAPFSVTLDFSAMLNCAADSPAFVRVDGGTIRVRVDCHSSVIANSYRVTAAIPPLSSGTYKVTGLVNWLSGFDPPPQIAVASAQLVVADASLPTLSWFSLALATLLLGLVGAGLLRAHKSA